MIVNNAAKIFLLPNGLCVDEASIWFVQNNSNKLIQISRADYSVENVILLDEECVRDNRDNYDVIEKINDSLYIFAYGKKYIYKYDLKKRELLKKEHGWDAYPVYANAILKHKDYICILPCWGNPFLKYYPESDELEVVSQKKESSLYMMSVGYEYIGAKGQVYATDREKNILYIVDLENEEIVEKEIGDVTNTYFGVSKIGKYFVLPNLNKKCITVWNEENGEIEEFVNFPHLFISNIRKAYKKIAAYGSKIYLLPSEANMILRFDLETKRIEKCFGGIEINNDDGTKIDREAFLDYFIKDDKVITYDVINARWLILDLKTEAVEIYSQGKFGKFEHLFKENFKALRHPVRESYYEKLDNFIEGICMENE